jgi:cyclophilin family peptidyl-prolyl cis-trans isomerase
MHAMTLRYSVAIAAVLLSTIIAPAAGQVRPERLYCGFGRSIPMIVERPAELSGDLSIRLLRPKSVEQGLYEVAGESAAAEGRVNLSTMFPELWTGGQHELLYAQLFVGSDPVGSAVVLQPMITPQRAHLYIERSVTDPASGAQVIVPVLTDDASRGKVMFEDERDRMLRAAGRVPPEREVVFSGLRTYLDQRVILDTTLGEIELMLRPDAAPNTAYNFLHLVGGGFYTNIIFHRIVPRTANGAPFVVQVGDPTGGGSGGPGYMIDLEPTTLEHGFGVISMARSGDPDSNGSQIFLCLSREGTKHLDGRYTAFGQMVRGGDVLLALAATPVDAEGRAQDPPILRSAKLVASPPVGTGALPMGEPEPAPVGR